VINKKHNLKEKLIDTAIDMELVQFLEGSNVSK